MRSDTYYKQKGHPDTVNSLEGSVMGPWPPPQKPTPLKQNALQLSVIGGWQGLVVIVVVLVGKWSVAWRGGWTKQRGGCVPSFMCIKRKQQTVVSATLTLFLTNLLPLVTVTSL